ncbi:MAG: glycoside hydrolase family 2 TIM barrel-domain containing protein [Phycisphaeraceae bacterium]
MSMAPAPHAECFSLTSWLMITLMMLAPHAPGQALAQQAATGPGPIKVEVVERYGRFMLLRDGKPFEMRAVSGFDELDTAAAAGVNTLRTWSTKHLDNGRILDEAHARGMGVMVGLWLGHKRDGFDYSDPEMVKEQYDRVTAEILKYKDHPAVLIWGIGNEAEARGGQPYEAIQQIAEFVKEVDPYHPTATVLAGSHVDRITAVRTRAPSIDILGINTYSHYANVAENVRKAGWTGPYIVTEIGNNGTWEGPRTTWDVPIEPPSGIKAQLYRERYLDLMANRRQCLAAFPFKWGYVPKGTSTWFSLFHANGEPNAVVDQMIQIWTGRWPQDRSPWVTELNIEGQPYDSSITLKPGTVVTAEVRYTHADPHTLDSRWQVKPEATIASGQGSQAINVTAVDTPIEVIDPYTIRFTVPSEPGPYRLYFYGYTPTDRLGSANAPFLVASGP